LQAEPKFGPARRQGITRSGLSRAEKSLLRIPRQLRIFRDDVAWNRLTLRATKPDFQRHRAGRLWPPQSCASVARHPGSPRLPSPQSRGYVCVSMRAPMRILRLREPPSPLAQAACPDRPHRVRVASMWRPGEKPMRMPYRWKYRTASRIPFGR
jgi:hypothetical protein